MSDLKTEAALRAVQWLKASGLQFAVIMPDGTKLGDLELAPVKEAKRRTRLHNWVEKTNYIETLNAMAVGDVFEWQVEPELGEAFQKCVSAQAGTRFGKGNYITQTKAGKVSIMRCA